MLGRASAPIVARLLKAIHVVFVNRWCHDLSLLLFEHFGPLQLSNPKTKIHEFPRYFTVCFNFKGGGTLFYLLKFIKDKTKLN